MSWDSAKPVWEKNQRSARLSGLVDGRLTFVFGVVCQFEQRFRRLVHGGHSLQEAEHATHNPLVEVTMRHGTTAVQLCTRNESCKEKKESCGQTL